MFLLNSLKHAFMLSELFQEMLIDEKRDNN